MTAPEVLRAPFPWFGGKSRAAPVIWRAFGDLPNYVEPFAGSLAVLLARPGGAGKVETANDKDGFIANVWRAITAAPADVARWCDWPVNEADLHARHAWLVARADELLEQLIADPEFFDAKIAGWWVWGLSAWIGSGWCMPGKGRVWRQLPKIGGPGHGVHAPTRRKPRTDRNHGIHVRDAAEVFQVLAERLRHVRVCCGDWTRVLGRSTLGIAVDHGTTPCGVLLDPPYAHGDRDLRLYREDDAALSTEVRAWALENGDNPALRIALCGWDGEHDMPPSWRRVEWRSTSGAQSASRERIWFSPHCLQAGVTKQGDLFAERTAAG
ncbi:MAG: DNA adenine methylase [Actinomycetota bacterium]|nr:DNA adenine methylase [Actinomycetota bacterium]